MGIFDFFKAKAPTTQGGSGVSRGLTLADYSAILYQAAGRQIAKSNHHCGYYGTDAAKLAVNHPYARRYLQIMTTNVVGAAGVRIQVRKRNDDGSLDSVGNRIVEQAWQAWGRAGFCTVDGRISWSQAQRLFIETLTRDGEVLIQKIKNPAGKPVWLFR